MEEFLLHQGKRLSKGLEICWGIMSKKTAIIRSKPFLLFRYVMILTHDFGDFYEGMVISLTIWTLSVLENASTFSFAVPYLESLSRGRKSLDMLWCSALILLCSGHLLFVDRDWKKAEIMAPHHFWSWRRVLPSRVMDEIFLVNCDAWELKHVELRSGHLMISADGWS